MEIVLFWSVMGVSLGPFLVHGIYCGISEYLTDRKYQPKPVLSAPDPDPLPAFIQKDRETPRKEWEDEYYSLVRKTCKDHYGTQKCFNCGTKDVTRPSNCDCDTIAQYGYGGNLVLFYRKEDTTCPYHTKEHHFASVSPELAKYSR